MRLPDVKRSIRAGVCLLAGLALASLRPEAAAAQGGVNQQEALKLAFPTATKIERRTAFLDQKQIEAARALAGEESDVRDGVINYYVALRGNTPLGAAYFDSHIVRTMPEVVMVVVTPRSVIDRIEVLRFTEPREFRPPPSWVDQMDGSSLNPDLSLNGRIRGLSGATLTARALTGAARRVLALHQIIAPFGPRASTR